MNKRLLNTLAKAGYFNSANGALYAAAKHVLRKSLNANHLQVIDAFERETSDELSFSENASDIRRSHHPMP